MLFSSIEAFNKFIDSYDNAPLKVANPLNAFAPAPKPRRTSSGFLRALFDGGVSAKAFFSNK